MNEDLMNLLMHIAVITLGGTLFGCGPSLPQWQSKPERITYSVATRQIPPETPYNRLTWVRAPDNLPQRELPDVTGPDAAAASPLVLPVVEFSVRSITLEEAARVLAATTRYEAYAASSIAGRRITMHRLGTVDELAEEIAKSAGIQVVVNHATRTIHFLGNRYVEPRFFEDSSAQAVESPDGETLAGGTERKVADHVTQSTY